MPRTVNLNYARTHFSALVRSLETGKEAEITLARNGKPAARLVPIESGPAATGVRAKPVRLGMFDGMFPSMSQEAFDADNDYIWRGLFDDNPEEG